MLFDEINIDTIIKDEKLYVCVSDLGRHLSKAAHEFASETEILAKMVGLTDKEKLFIMGIIEGMYNVVVMLAQSSDEHELKKINTIDELLEKFNESDK